MKKDILVDKLISIKNDNVYVLIEDDLYYPIKEVIDEKGNTVIVCKNIKKVRPE